jgi:putative tryptophan/tyrosine transport system substrate-binding protein
LCGGATTTASCALEARFLAVAGLREEAEVGILLRFGLSTADMCRYRPVYVDKIFKEADLAILPVAQPTKFELVINRMTAMALDITVPDALRALAGEHRIIK